ncbi:MAG: FAD-binding oxidoreductase [Aquamicrobium sp.]|nr:FAD-binding oxidoreductase [Aquamicrobium sp.]
MEGLARLLDALGPEVACPGAQADPRFLRDWTAAAPVVPLALIRPRTTGEVSAALALCNAERIAVVPQGGRTGLVGGAQPLADAVVVSLDRLSAPPAIDPLARIATVDAGVTLAALQAAAAGHGLAFPVDFGARGSCQIGGMISTNAGGIRAFRHGMTRANVLGLEAVLPGGRVVNAMNRHLKNNAGYDIRQLFIGAEGTLGIVTRAVLRLVEAEPLRATALLAVPDVAAARAVLDRLERLPGLAALEAMWPRYWSYACEATGFDPLSLRPSGHEIVLLAELRGWEEEALQSALLTAAAGLTEEGTVLDSAFAASEAQAEGFWRLREANAELYRHFPHLLGFDVSIDPGRMEELIARIGGSLTSEEQALWFGHMGDANLHLGLARTDPSPDRAKRLKCVLYDAVRDLEGSVSAEHGIGAEKLEWLGHTRNAAEIALMQSLRAMLDPNGIMNPGRTVPRGG